MPNTVLTPELHQAIVESVRRGSSARRAAIANGISDEALRTWQTLATRDTYANGFPVDPAQKQRILALLEDISRARAECYTVLTSSLYHNATTQNEKTGWYDTQAADKLLSKSPEHREEWYENRKLEVTRTEPFHELEQAKALSDDDLRAALELPPGEGGLGGQGAAG